MDARHQAQGRPPDDHCLITEREGAHRKAANRKPFVVAVAEAKNWQARPLSFKRFVTLYDVRATDGCSGL